MQLRGIDFGDVFAASGSMGFFGEGYWHHRFFWPAGLESLGITFVSKTATIAPRAGNMPLRRDHTPAERFPACVKVRPFRGEVVNAVGLSNPGIGALLNTGRWQTRTAPFLISVASVASTREERVGEMRAINEIIRRRRHEFKGPFGIEINVSCPNAGEATDKEAIIGEVRELTEALETVGVPLIPKLSVSGAVAARVAGPLQADPNCDAICVSNTLPWGWGERRDVSPLSREGFTPGGISGAMLLPFVTYWINDLRFVGFKKPVNGGGGILSREDVWAYRRAGASAVFLGSVTILRPWRVKGIVAEAKSLDWS